MARIFIKGLLGAISLKVPQEHRIDEEDTSNAPDVVEDKDESAGSSED